MLIIYPRYGQLLDDLCGHDILQSTGIPVKKGPQLYCLTLKLCTTVHHEADNGGATPPPAFSAVARWHQLLEVVGSQPTSPGLV